MPFLNNQWYQIVTNKPVGSNNGAPYLADRDAEYLPYAGPVPQGSTFLAHAHIGAKYQKRGRSACTTSTRGRRTTTGTR